MPPHPSHSSSGMKARASASRTLQGRLVDRRGPVRDSLEWRGFGGRSWLTWVWNDGGDSRGRSAVTNSGAGASAELLAAGRTLARQEVTVRAKFSRQLRRSVGRRAVAGDAIEGLAEEHGCHPVSVVMWAAVVRVEMPEPPPLPHPGRSGHPEVLRRVVVQEHAAGRTASEVGQRHGVSAATVSAWSRIS